jgi:hypothetical protein
LVAGEIAVEIAAADRWRLLMGTGDTTMGGADMGRGFAPGEWANAPWRRSYGWSRWGALDIAAMVLGFMIYWPIGLAILGYKIYQRKTGAPDLQTVASAKWDEARSAMASGPWASRNSSCGWAGFGSNRGRGFYSPPTGNSAFDDWKVSELSRLDEERRRLDEAHREFSEYVEAIRRAKDREEFDRFMMERRARQASGPTQPGSAA